MNAEPLQVPEASEPDPLLRPLAGTVFQPSYAAWPTRLDGSWSAWMTRLSHCGVRRVIVQHLAHLSMDGGIAAHAPVYDILLGSARSTPYGVLGGWSDADALLQAAHAHGIQVDVGLSAFMPQELKDEHGQPVWAPGRTWAWLSQRANADELRPWLARAAAADERIATAWHQRYGARRGSHAAWHGWYLANELDDRSWRVSGSREVWVSHLQGVIQHLHSLDRPSSEPARPIAISGFANVDTTLDAVTKQWQDWLTDLAVDEVLFQDSIGAKRQPRERVEALYAGLAAVVRSRGRVFTPVVELFRDGSTRSASVAEAEEALELAAAAALVEAQDAPPGWVCFDVPNDVIGTRPGAQALSARFERAP